MVRILKVFSLIIIVAVVIFTVLYLYLPGNRVKISSELIMLGDFNNDKVWNEKDRKILEGIERTPFSYDALTLFKADVNRNYRIDSEDLVILNGLFRLSDPYKAEEAAKEKGLLHPRPRELFYFLPVNEYVQSPLFTLRHGINSSLALSFLKELESLTDSNTYESQILREIYSEAIRFSLMYEKRKDSLSDVEKVYVKSKLETCENLYREKHYYDLLLNIISLVEDAETLTISSQSEFIRNILFFRDHLKDLIVSKDFTDYENGDISHKEILKIIEKHLAEDLDIKISLEKLGSPRDFKNVKNYIERAEWQKHKSSTTSNEFKKLTLFAQHDRRYLRAVSNTTPKFQDRRLEMHNLPMILLFRKALEISGSKKAAIGLLDETVRIPLGWVKGIPKEILPASIALDNFLLPGNMEDGLDKTRHWNVFGGVAIYKSPKDSLILSLKREIMDLRHEKHSPEAMKEFIRDTIANINGIYYVISIDPELTKRF